jgi:two-component sensor histidine kinase
MAETIDNLILEHLRSLRTDNAEVKTSLRDIKARLASIESYIATLHGDQTRASVSIDELADRVNRLEVRTGISDA